MEAYIMKTISYLKYLSFCILISFFITQSAYAAKNNKTFLQLSTNYDDILKNNEYYTVLSLSSKWTHGINRHSNFSTRGKISTKNYTASNDDNRNKMELQIAYNYQVSKGYYSPTYSAQLKVIKEIGDNDYETNKLSLAFIRRQPITNTIELSLGFKTQEHSGTEKRTINSLFLNTDFILNYQTLIYIGLNISDENIDINNPNNNVGASNKQLVSNNVSISSHHSVITPTINNPNSSNISSDNTSISMGLIYQIKPQHSLDFLYMRNNYTTDSTLKNTIFSIDYFYKF